MESKVSKQFTFIDLQKNIKRCSLCLEWMSLNCFFKDKYQKVGYKSRCKECLEKTRYTPQYKERVKKYNNRPDVLEARKAYEQTEQYKSYHKNYELTKRKRNKERDNELRRIRETKRRETDILYKLKQNCSRRIRYAIKKGSKKTLDFLDCSIVELKNHLESQFLRGMSWNNYGEWEIDHIFPTSKAENSEHLIKLFHYTNLQPLWKTDNRKKLNKIL